jgi:hypothetical protein
MIDTDPRLHVRRFEVTRYGRTVGHRIDPADYGCAELAAELADLYAPIHAEIPETAERVVVGIRAFLRWLSYQPAPLPRTLAEVTATHLHDWERWLGTQQQEQRSHAAYDKFVNFRALLLRSSQDHPTCIHPTVHHLLASPTVTVLPEMRPLEGLPPFSPDEQQAILRSAYRDVAWALRATGGAELGDRLDTVLIALHVLLAVGTGEPPEVLRNLRLDDIRPLAPSAEVHAPTGLARASWLDDVVRSRPTGYCLQLRKLRAHALYDTFVTRRDRHSCFALEASLRITLPFRRADGSDALWVDAQGRHAVFANRARLSKWLDRHGIEVEGEKAFARFRKTVVGAEAMADPATYLATARRHRAPTFFRSYKNNPVLRAHSGRILVGAIDAAFQQAVQPTVLTPDDIDRMRNGQPPGHASLSKNEQRALLDGTLEGPHAACRDPLHSPFDRAGDACGSSASGL